MTCGNGEGGVADAERRKKIAVSGKLNIVLGEKNPGEKGRTDKVVNQL